MERLDIAGIFVYGHYMFKLIDTTQLPSKGTLKYKVCKWFCNYINFCHGVYYDAYDAEGTPIEKPENKIYNFFYKYWLFPFKQTDCICCNTVRGLIYGGVLGYILRGLL